MQVAYRVDYVCDVAVAHGVACTAWVVCTSWRLCMSWVVFTATHDACVVCAHMHAQVGVQSQYARGTGQVTLYLGNKHAEASVQALAIRATPPAGLQVSAQGVLRPQEAQVTDLPSEARDPGLYPGLYPGLDPGLYPGLYPRLYPGLDPGLDP